MKTRFLALVSGGWQGGDPMTLRKREGDHPGVLANVHPTSGKARAPNAARELGLSVAWHLLTALANCQRSPGERIYAAYGSLGRPGAPHTSLRPRDPSARWLGAPRAQQGERRMRTRC